MGNIGQAKERYIVRLRLLGIGKFERRGRGFLRDLPFPRERPYRAYGKALTVPTVTLLPCLRERSYRAHGVGIRDKKLSCLAVSTRTPTRIKITTFLYVSLDIQPSLGVKYQPSTVVWSWLFCYRHERSADRPNTFTLA